MRRLLAGIILLCSQTGLFALDTRIEGHISGFYNKTLYLWVLSDPVTGQKDLLGTAVISVKGDFSLQVEVEDTLPATISIGPWSTSFFLLPGQHQRCRVLTNYDSLLQVRVPQVKQVLPLKIEFTSSGDPNLMIPRFDSLYQSFLAQHGEQMLKQRSTRLFDSLMLVVTPLFHPETGNFTALYCRYSLAMLEGMVRRWSTAQHFDTYLRDKPILYNNPGYMMYFNDIFDQYLTSASKNITFRDLDFTINQKCDLLALTDTLGKDAILWSERLRELVLLKNLGELYHDPSFSKANILRMITQLGQSSKFSEHRIIATNLVHVLTRFDKGSPAPPFSMIDQFGRERALQDCMGKWVYLGFFTTWCDDCVAELKVESSLREKFGQKVEFMNISCDLDPLALTNFLRMNKKFDWSFFPIEGSAELLEYYQVFAYPFYVLIDPEGTIYRYPAVKPSEGAENLFNEILKQ